MRELFLGMLMLGSLSSAYAGVNFKCNADGFMDYIDSNGAGIFGEHLLARCEAKNGEHFDVSFFGIGPGLRVSNGNFLINCPLVRKKKILGSYMGTKVSAIVGAGPTLALLSNHRLGVCTIAGLEVGLGASVSIGRMKISKGRGNSYMYGFQDLGD